MNELNMKLEVFTDGFQDYKELYNFFFPHTHKYYYILETQILTNN